METAELCAKAKRADAGRQAAAARLAAVEAAAKGAAAQRSALESAAAARVAAAEAAAAAAWAMEEEQQGILLCRELGAAEEAIAQLSRDMEHVSLNRFAEGSGSV